MAFAPPRRRRRRVLGALAAVVLLGAAAAGAYLWVLSNWFVGVQDTDAGERVTVYRGLDTSLVGMELNRVSDVTDVPVADLTPAAASKVQRGIEATDAEHAQRIVTSLRDQRLPLCPTEEDVEPEPLPPTTAPAPTPTPAPNGVAPTDAAPAPPEPTTPAPTSQRATATQEPGVDCREAE